MHLVFHTQGVAQSALTNARAWLCALETGIGQGKSVSKLFWSVHTRSLLHWPMQEEIFALDQWINARKRIWMLSNCAFMVWAPSGFREGGHFVALTKFGCHNTFWRKLPPPLSIVICGRWVGCRNTFWRTWTTTPPPLDKRQGGWTSHCSCPRTASGCALLSAHSALVWMGLWLFCSVVTFLCCVLWICS